MKTTSTYGATLIDCMGDDRTVVNAARVSFGKQVEEMGEADERLIGYLARNGHWSPYSHPQLSFRVSAPLFVARQLGKHQVGLAWNEESRRYVDSEPAFYVPTEWRKRAENVKQGSSDEVVECFPSKEFIGLTEIAFDAYRIMLEIGVCPEQARMILPQSMIVNWVWTGSLYAFARVVKQRLDNHAQRECAPVANDIAAAMRERFAVTYAALMA